MVETTGRKFTKKKEGEESVRPTRVPPNSIETEEIVLGALMIEKDAYPLVGELLRPACFYEPKNRLIFEAIQDLALLERPVDVQTVIEQLKKNKTLHEVGGEYYPILLSTQINSTAHLETHARILYDKALQRELISFGNEVIKNAFDESIDVVDTMQDAESKLFEITQRTDKDEVEHVKHLIGDALKQIEQASSRKEGISGLNTGFREIDDMTSGWQSPDLVIIAARPAMGKTAFVLSMARAMAMDYGIPVAIFSLEMSKTQIMTRLIVNHTEIPNDKIKRGNLDQEELRQLNEGLDPLYEAPLFIDDNAGLSIFDLRSKARRLVREHDVKMIVIDYLQLMTASGMRANTNREQEVSMISRSLKQLAKELNIPIIALSQLNRSVENRGDGKIPQLSDLRESGAIEQDADMVCFIHRPEYYGITEDKEDGRDLRGLGQFIIAKHRNGPTGAVYLRFKQEFIKFTSALDHPIHNKTQHVTMTSSLNADVSDAPSYDLEV